MVTRATTGQDRKPERPAAKVRHPDKAGLHLRIVLPQGAVLGPGRAEIMEAIRDLGSIAAAARSMKMSYRRAWFLLASISSDFGAPVVAAAPGGAQGGGATLTELGAALVACYRRVEANAAAAAADELASLETLVQRHQPAPPSQNKLTKKSRLRAMSAI